MSEEVTIEKLVHGGQGLSRLSDGRKVFVWNALPGEIVRAKITKKRRDYAEGIVEEVIIPSHERIEPLDAAYLSTSPWQMMTWQAENKYKIDILKETFTRENVNLPEFNFIAAGKAGPVCFSESEFISEGSMENPTGVFHYRNKMEYSFWADDDGLHLALFHRASHSKQIVQGSSIARPEIDTVANHILEILNKNGVRGSQLKTVVLRTNTNGEVIAALFVKDDNFPSIDFSGICKGVTVVYSNPKSPASVVTKELYAVGHLELTEIIRGTSLTYGVNSFFQVNIPVFEKALDVIARHTTGKDGVVDMYAGVGAIGLCVGAEKLVELDSYNLEMAKRNAVGKDVEIIHASTEQSLEHITSDTTVIFDPPRAGLHEKVVERILEVQPEKIVYVSCNPSTQARDLARLISCYEIEFFEGYNFFPRTPHVESLAVLVKH